MGTISSPKEQESVIFENDKGNHIADIYTLTGHLQYLSNTDHNDRILHKSTKTGQVSYAFTHYRATVTLIKANSHIYHEIGLFKNSVLFDGSTCGASG